MGSAWFSGQKPFSLLGGGHPTGIPPSIPAKAVAGDVIVQRITQPARDDPQHRGQPPPATQSGENGERGVGAYPEALRLLEHDGFSRPRFAGKALAQPATGGFSLQRREPVTGPAIVTDQKADQAVAEIAESVEIDDERTRSTPGRGLRNLLAAGCWLTVSLRAADLAAQSYWHDDRERGVVRAEFLRPFLREFDLKTVTGALFLSASGPLGEHTRLEGELPLAFGGLAGNPESSARVAGNPYLGLRIQRPGSPISTQIGVRFPVIANLTTTSEFGIEAAAASDADRVEAFFYKRLTGRIGVEIRPSLPGTFLLGVRVGGSVFVPTEQPAADGDGGDTEFFLDYGGRIGAETASVLTAVALTGRLFVTSGGGSLADRTKHQLTGSLDWRRGVLRPGLLALVPLDDSDVDWVLGLRLTVVP